MRLIEIKLDEQGNKSLATVEENKIQRQVKIEEIIEYIKTGRIIRSAKVENDELFYCFTKRKCPELEEKTFGEWKVKEYLGNKQWLCECSCTKRKSVATNSLTLGKSTNCGHSKGLIDIKGKTFGTWYVIEYVGEHRWKCQCLCGCGTIRNIRGDALRNKKPPACDSKNKFIDMTDTYINEWHILEYMGNNMWKCQCSCNNIQIVNGTNIRNGESKSCGHSTAKDLSNTFINGWYVIEYVGDRKYKCECACGRIKEVYDTNLTQGISKSCGNCNKPDEQLELITTAEKFNSFLLRNVMKLQRPLLIDEVAELCGISPTYAKQLVKRHDALNYVRIKTASSNTERELADFVKSLGVDIIQNDKTILKGKELDIYIPEYKLALEFNGDYWHSTEKRNKAYHFEKSRQCEELGIHLLHIFEHEWNNLETQQKLKDLICKILHINQKIIYARKTTVQQISKDIATKFLEQYHLQGTVGCETAYGLYYENELVQVMTFGVPRFNRAYDTELLRLCSKAGYEIVGGASKLFKHYIKQYPTESIISYCNYARFYGNVYTNIGMKYDGFTPPDYVYINNKEDSILSRQQCMKHKLLAQGYGTLDMTEEQIMKKRGYSKVYDCGNKRYVYERTNSDYK